MNAGYMAERALAVCNAKGWDRGWSNGGCYLHLEVSEFIESLRGKGDSSPTSEVGDVLFVLFAMCKAHGISFQEVEREFHAKMDKLVEGLPGASGKRTELLPVTQTEVIRQRLLFPEWAYMLARDFPRIQQWEFQLKLPQPLPFRDYVGDYSRIIRTAGESAPSIRCVFDAGSSHSEPSLTLNLHADGPYVSNMKGVICWDFFEGTGLDRDVVWQSVQAAFQTRHETLGSPKT